MRAAVLVVLAACTVPPPFHVLETTETLQARKVSLTAGGGGGGGNHLNDCCAGAAARVRVGIGNRQEVGVDGELIGSKDTVIGGIKLAYKVSPADGVAIVAGPGVMVGGDTGDRTAVGGDVGAIASSPVGRRLQLYAALRGSLAVPVRSDVYALGGVSEALVLPIGLAVPLGPTVRLLGELGGIGSLSQTRDGRTMDVESHSAVGWYGALALTFTP
jgi:hypothetical protein